MGQLVPVIGAVVDEQRAVAGSPDDGAASKDARRCCRVFKFPDLDTQRSGGLPRSAAAGTGVVGGAGAGGSALRGGD